MISLGSGEPTRAPRPGCDDCVAEILHIRHHSLFAPRDFDISPYFRVVKPAIEEGFDHRALVWAEIEHRQPA